MLLSMPLGKVVAVVAGVMSDGSSGNRVSHWVVAAVGSCVGYCCASWVRRC
jgi:hypothetical protein